VDPPLVGRVRELTEAITVRKLALVLLAVPALALAQDAAPQLQEDPRVPKFRDVERGFFVGFEVGYLGLNDTPTHDKRKYPLAGNSGGSAGGMLVAALVGYDVTPYLSIAAVGEGGNEKASANYGAFSLVGAGLDVRLAVKAWHDRNDWERLFVYAHGRGTYAWSFPEGLFGSSEFLVGGGPGFEYFTKLRHFSVGAAVDVVYATKAGAAGYAIYPTLRYTF
jgi:hypothetical protein